VICFTKGRLRFYNQLKGVSHAEIKERSEGVSHEETEAKALRSATKQQTGERAE
jgi:hypothetical protein